MIDVLMIMCLIFIFVYTIACIFNGISVWFICLNIHLSCFLLLAAVKGYLA